MVEYRSSRTGCQGRCTSPVTPVAASIAALSAGAHWHGEVHALSAVIAGTISGAILVSEKIEIAATAVIRGRVSARRIAMARGATVEGELTVTSGEPVIQFEEKRGAR